MAVKDYYRILGVEMKSSTEEVKRAYRRLAKNYHPDAQPNNHDLDNNEKFKEITEAYKVLSDPEKRKKYDQMNAIGNGVSGSYQPFDLNVDDEEVHLEEEVVWEDVVDPVTSESVYDEEEVRSSNSGSQDSVNENESRGNGKSTEKTENGKIAEMEVSFELAVKGGNQFLTIPGEEECEKCGGTGTLSRKRGRCSRCKGEGRSRKDVKIQVEVPPGVDDGTRILLTELVLAEDKAGCDGIWIEFKVKSHPFFQRKGLDILCEAPIGIDKAILGGDISVKTAMGRRVSIKIPPGTDSGTIFRIRNEGIARNGRRGHQLVKVKIVTPKHLSNKAREYFHQFLRETQSKLR